MNAFLGLPGSIVQIHVWAARGGIIRCRASFILPGALPPWLGSTASQRNAVNEIHDWIRENSATTRSTAGQKSCGRNRRDPVFIH
jgi:hypothetical protein